MSQTRLCSAPSSSLLRASLTGRAVALMLLAAATVVGFAGPAQVEAQIVAKPGSVTTTSFQGAYAGEGLALDAAGNIYAGFDSTVGLYKITYSNGTYTSAAMTGSPQLGFYGVAVNASGVVYASPVDVGTAADYGVYTATPVAGGTYTFSHIITTNFQAAGVAVDTAGNVYTNNYTTSVYKYILSGGVYTQNVIASDFSKTRNMAIGATGIIYQADQTKNRVQTLTPVGPVATTTTYTEATIYTCSNGCAGVAVTSNGTVYVGDGTTVIQLVPNGGGGYVVTTISTSYSAIRGMAVDANGNVVVSDLNNKTISKTTVALTDFGPVGLGSTSTAQAVSFVVSSNANSTAFGTPKTQTQGATSEYTVSSTTCGGTPTANSNCTVTVAFKPTGVGLRRGAVQITDSTGAVVATAYLRGVGNAAQLLVQPGVLKTTYSTTLNNPRGLTVDTAGNVFVSNSFVNSVLKFPAGSTTPTQLATAGGSTTGTAVDGAGNVFFGSTVGIYELVGGAGTPVSVNSTLTSSDNNLSADAFGNLYTSDQNTGAIYELLQGNYGTTTTLVAGGAGHRFIGMAVDSGGNLFAADYVSNTLYEVVAGSGTLTQLYTGTPLSAPHSLAVDAAGDLYVGNNNNNGSVYRFGAGSYGSTPATLAVPGSQSLAVGADGSIYTVAGNSLFNYTRSTLPTFSFANTAVGNTSSSKTVTLENDGTTALTLPIPAAGQNPSLSPYFSLSNSSTCPLVYSTSGAAGTLAAGASCTDIVSFVPTLPGAVSGALVFTDNNLSVTGSTQTIKTTGTTATVLTVTAVSQNVIIATPSVMLQFSVGYGSNVAPTSTPTLTVAGSSTGVGTISCTPKSGHNTCFATYNTSALGRGTYTILATQPADGTYAASTGTAILTITNAAGQSSVSPVQTLSVKAPVVLQAQPVLQRSAPASVAAVVMSAPADASLATLETSDSDSDTSVDAATQSKAHKQN